MTGKMLMMLITVASWPSWSEPNAVSLKYTSTGMVSAYTPNAVDATIGER